jgi:hypothetical protein
MEDDLKKPTTNKTTTTSVSSSTTTSTHTYQNAGYDANDKGGSRSMSDIMATVDNDAEAGQDGNGRPNTEDYSYKM